jgi:hypothetical protein
VCFDIRREKVGPIVFRDEIKIGNRSGVKGGKDGILPRITDGCGRKPGEKIGVVRSWLQQMLSGQISIKILNSVNDGGITLESDLFLQTVVKNG